MYYYQRTALFHYSAVEHVTTFVAMVVYSYIVSFALNLLIEMPSARLLKHAMTPTKVRSPRDNA